MILNLEQMNEIYNLLDCYESMWVRSQMEVSQHEANVMIFSDNTAKAFYLYPMLSDPGRENYCKTYEEFYKKVTSALLEQSRAEEANVMEMEEAKRTVNERSEEL